MQESGRAHLAKPRCKDRIRASEAKRWGGRTEEMGQSPTGRKQPSEPEESEDTLHSVLLEKECNVLNTLDMIKIQVIKASLQWEKKVRGLEIFQTQNKITDDAFFKYTDFKLCKELRSFTSGICNKADICWRSNSVKTHQLINCCKSLISISIFRSRDKQ